MARSNIVYGAGLLVVVLVVAAAIVIYRRPPEPGTAAAFRAMSATAAGANVPYSVPMDIRRANADTCTGYNLELVEGAGIQTRIGNHGEAQRLLSMQQSCASAPGIIRSAR